jgi:AcrR family transcriptional regulator
MTYHLILYGFNMDNQINNMENLSRREREKALHRQQIMDAAIKVFAKKGYHVATLEEIAQEAEFSKGALYLYFSNKEDLMYSIIDDAMKEWDVLVDTIITGERSFKEEITDMFICTAEEIFKKPNISDLISAQHAIFFRSVSEEKRNKFIEKHNQHWKSIENRVRKAIANGELREIPVHGITGMIHGPLDAMLHNRWNCKTLHELKDAIEVVVDILFNGIGKKKEAKGA